MKDNDGKTPLDLIPSDISPSSKQELVGILGKQPISIPCSQLKTPLKKLERNYQTMQYYIALMVITFMQMHLFVFPHIETSWVLIMNIFFIIINYSFCKASFSDPGYVKGVPNL